MLILRNELVSRLKSVFQKYQYIRDRSEDIWSTSNTVLRYSFILRFVELSDSYVIDISNTICYPEVEEFIYPESTTTICASIGGDIFHLSDGKYKNKGYMLGSPEDLSTLVIHITEIVTNYVFPYFERVATPHDIIQEILEQDQTHIAFVKRAIGIAYLQQNFDLVEKLRRHYLQRYEKMIQREENKLEDFLKQLGLDTNM